MKKQITRLSPHQNARLVAVLMAFSSLFFVFPILLILSQFAPARGHQGPPVLVFWVMPILYLVMGYITVFVGCLIYNFLAKCLGGIEYESA
jgi:hypothetical protein